MLHRKTDLVLIPAVYTCLNRAGSTTDLCQPYAPAWPQEASRPSSYTLSQWCSLTSKPPLLQGDHTNSFSVKEGEDMMKCYLNRVNDSDTA